MKATICLIFGCLALALPKVQAQFSYTTNDGTVTVTGYSGPSSVVAIPSTIHSMPVTGVTSTSQASWSGVTDLTIPDSVTNLSATAFGYSGLVSVTLGNGLSAVGDAAFEGCANLKNVIIGTNIALIGNSAFYDCPSLTSITIPASVRSIEAAAFQDAGLTVVTLPGGLTNLGAQAFLRCALTNVSVPDSVRNIGGNAFGSDAYLTNVTIGRGVTSIGGDSFSGCSSLTSLTIPDLVTNIGEFAFAGCARLATITLGTNVGSIGDFAFQGPNTLIDITLPASVTNIGAVAFDKCYGLKSINVEPGNPALSSVDGVLFNQDQSVLIKFPPGKKATSYVVPPTVTSIALEAFTYCSDLTTVMIPAGVTNLGTYAFGFCSGLTGVYFEGNAPTAGSTVFYGAAPTVYYLPGTTGWDSFSYSETWPWTQPQPTIFSSDLKSGVQANGFGFTVSWATNIPVVVESSTNLANPVWDRLQTNMLTNGLFHFSDPQWASHAARFYRIVTP